jgi:hypothetical protein
MAGLPKDESQGMLGFFIGRTNNARMTEPTGGEKRYDMPTHKTE